MVVTKAFAPGLLLMLAGCASTVVPPHATYDRIQDEVRQAAQQAPKPAAVKPVPAPPARPEAVDRALLPPLESLPAKPALPPEPRFDLAVSNAPAQQVFLSIVTGTRYSMLVHPDVSGNMTIHLKDVTVREAMETIRDLYGYEYRVQGNRISILPNTLQTRIFQINYLASRRQGMTDMRVTSGSISSAQNPNAGTGTGTPAPATSGGAAPNATSSSLESSRVSTRSENDFWGDLTAAMRTIVGTEGGRQVIVNAMSGVIAVRGMPADIRNVENYLRTTQLIVERQVMLEAKIIEVQLSDGASSGINWSGFRSKSNRGTVGVGAPGTILQPNGPLVSGASGIDYANRTFNDPRFVTEPGSTFITDAANLGSMFGLAFQSQSFAALLQFLETQGAVQVLSSPRIATINNQKAVLKVGTDEFFVTSVTTNTSTSGTNTTMSPTITVQPFFSGIALDVTPQIDDGDEVILHLHPSISVVTEKQKNINLGSLGNFQLPLAASTVNESDSVVRVQDGNIVAIGGLMRQQQNASASGLPGTTDSPLGVLFGQRNKGSSKSELVILLKPTIIRGSASWKQDLAETEQRLQGYDPRLMNQRPNPQPAPQ
jgi:MSHA biogenesis protein MshL